MATTILSDETVSINRSRLINKPITRETGIEERGRPLVITLHQRYMTVRRKGTQESYNVPYDAVFSMGAKTSAMMRLSK